MHKYVVHRRVLSIRISYPHLTAIQGITVLNGYALVISFWKKRILSVLKYLANMQKH